jgi:IPT/TIG domain-containing protein/subtilase family protein
MRTWGSQPPAGEGFELGGCVADVAVRRRSLVARARRRPERIGRPTRRLAWEAALLTAFMVAAVSIPSAAAAAGSRPSIHQRGPGVSLAPSGVRPHWACPTGVCEAIIDPPPVRVGAEFALPHGGPPLQGHGELGGYDPQDLQAAYRIPTTSAATQIVAVIDAYGYPDAEADLAVYRERYGLPPCTKADGCFKKVNESGEEANYPEERSSDWQYESALDMEIASAACPSCNIMLVEATTEATADTSRSVDTAAALGAAEISNSYGYPEGYEYEPWCGKAGCTQYNAAFDHPGVLITASAGDSGYDNRYAGSPFHSPNFPAASPYVVAVGGTSLYSEALNPRGWSEAVWNELSYSPVGTGSGCSTFELKPPWQSDAGCAGRMDNDVAAVAACSTPVSVYATTREQREEEAFPWLDVCGTSVSSPLVAGIMAHASTRVRSLGAQAIYESPGTLFDVARGTNTDVCEVTAYFCEAELGYDGPTGLGTPNGVPGRVSIRSVDADEGPATGGTTVTITGSGFTGATEVRFGSSNASSFAVESEDAITAVSPPGEGIVDVTVITPEGTSPSIAADHFSYAGTPPEFGRGVKVAQGTGRYKAGCHARRCRAWRCRAWRCRRWSPQALPMRRTAHPSSAVRASFRRGGSIGCGWRHPDTGCRFVHPLDGVLRPCLK